VRVTEGGEGTDMVLVELSADQGVLVALLDIAEMESTPAAEE
jgi:hypothetical protein